jgi:hypothetical protein
MTQPRLDARRPRASGARGQRSTIDPLVEQLAWVLGLEHDWRIAMFTHRLSLGRP